MKESIHDSANSIHTNNIKVRNELQFSTYSLVNNLDLNYGIQKPMNASR